MEYIRTTFDAHTCSNEYDRNQKQLMYTPESGEQAALRTMAGTQIAEDETILFDGLDTSQASQWDRPLEL